MNLWRQILLFSGLLAITITVSAQTKPETPGLLLCEADALRAANAYTPAYAAYKRAYPYFEASGEYYTMAYIKTWTSEMAFEGGASFSDGGSAVQDAYKVANAHLHIDTLSFYPIMLINMGIYYGGSGNYEKGIAFYQKGKTSAQRIHGQYNEYTSMAYTNLGFAYGSRGNWKKSLAYSDTALLIAEGLKDQSGIYGAQNNRAHVYAEMGDFEKALFIQRKALNAAVEDKEYARAANNLGCFYIEIKDWENGIRYLDEALNVRRQLSDTLTESIFSTKLNLVWAYSDMGETEKSDKLLNEIIKEAKTYAPTFDNSVSLQIAYNYLARNARQSNHLQKALMFIREAEQVSSNSIQTAASTQMIKSRVLRAQNKTEEALWAVQKSYQILIPGYKPKSVSNCPDWRFMEAIAYTLTLFELQAKLLENLAIEKQQPELQLAALNILESADSAVTVSRLSYQSQLSRDMMAANAGALYDALINLHYKLYQQSQADSLLERAFLYMEKNKALSVLENLNKMEAARFHDIPESLVAEERSIREDIAFYQLKLKADWLDEAPELKKQWLSERERLRNAQDSLLRIIEDQFPRYHKTRIDLVMPDLKSVREKVLAPDETMIEYFQSDSAWYVLLADAETTHFLRLPAENLVADILTLHEALRSKDPAFASVSHRVYQKVFEPLQQYIKGKKLVLIPDGPLSYIPFDQFVTENGEGLKKSYLMESYRIRRLLSGSTALQYEGIQKAVGKRYGIMGMAPLFTSGAGSVRASGQYGALSGAQKEIRVLEELFRGEFFRGHEATEEAFKRNCSSSGILHLATHTAINDQFPTASHLLLKETEREDGQLNVFEIYGQSIPAQLGFLSGCNTGFGKVQAGEGAVSLGHAFAYAGCPNIVMTLWPIKDDLAPDLVRVFYEGIKDGLDKAEALRQAKLYSLNSDELFAHPYYWSGFVYTGDRSPVERASFMWIDYPWGLIIGLVVVIIAVGVWWRKKG